MDLVSAEFAEIHEESAVDLHPAFGFGVQLHHPALDAFRIKLSVPRRVKRVGEIDALAVAAELDHLRSAVQRQVRLFWVSGLANDSAQVHRSGFTRVEWVGNIELQKLAGPEAGNVQEAVVEGEIDVRNQRRDRFEALQQRRQQGR